MKQYEYEARFDKDIFGTEQHVHYHIEILTNNPACYQELKSDISNVITRYETTEALSDEQNRSV